MVVAIWLPKCLHWPFCPGVFIAILAFVAAAMTFRKDPGPRERAIWIFLFLGLMSAEVWMMSLDRETNENQQQQARDAQLKGFNEIGDGIKGAIAESDRNFAATIGRTNQVLQSITGGDSFAFLVPQTHAVTANGLPLAIHNDGKYMLTGVTVTVWGPHVFEFINPFDIAPFYVGTLSPGERRTIGLSLKPLVDEKHDEDSYWIRIAAQNFTADQILNIRRSKWKVPGIPWAYKYYVSKTTFRPNGTSTQRFLIKPTEWSDDLGDGKPTKP